MLRSMPHDRTKFHGSAAWKKARHVARIEARHTCASCHTFLPGKGQLHVHHRKPLAKAMALALEPLNFMVLCSPCHNRIEPRSGTPRIKSACNEQGYPVSSDHPWFRK
jgi:5-methylcytosine-specific restriction endonuclease McrA